MTVEGDEAHHAVAVRRLPSASRSSSPTVPVSCQRAVAETGKRVFAVVVTGVDRLPRPTPEVVVVQAIPKGDRGELAVEVLTEIGVGRIVPWAASRASRSGRASGPPSRWPAGGPPPARPPSRPAGPGSPRSYGAGVDRRRGRPGRGAPTSRSCCTRRRPRRCWPTVPGDVPDGVVVVVGPEGGLSDDEVAAFVAAGAVSVRLGTEVLRTSTAGVAAVAALLSRTARWG